MKKWEVLNKLKTQNSKVKSSTQNSKLEVNDIINVLLENRAIKTEKEREEYLHPKLEEVTTQSVNIDQKQLKKALKRIQEAITNKEQIVVFGDYDVDGICGSAILWETLRDAGAVAIPYIPHRIDEGYGLSLPGISNVQSQISNIKLIITVDNGIVASKAVDFANKQGIDVIITDHHVLSTGGSETLPKAHAIVHTTAVCGTGVAYLFAQEIIHSVIATPSSPRGKQSNTDEIATSSSTPRNDKRENDHLALVALATVADLVPLKGANRTLLFHGLKVLQQTPRIGLRELCREAAIDQRTIGTYEIGHVIAPRLNAAGRLEYAMDSLRLLCTNNPKRAEELAQTIGGINRERQGLTIESVAHAKAQVQSSSLRQSSGQELKTQNLLFIAHETYQPGVIGLIAGRLVEEFYRPAIVLSIGETHSKASARSIAGFNIIEFIRTASHLLVDAGGHPMAAGFTVETAKITELQETLAKKADEVLADESFTRVLKIDCELPLSVVNLDLYRAIAKLAPFGMGNAEPVFMSSVEVVDKRFIGRDMRHVKLKVQSEKLKVVDAIAFGMAEQAVNVKTGDTIDIAYTIDENEWNGNTMLQLKVKNFKAIS